MTFFVPSNLPYIFNFGLNKYRALLKCLHKLHDPLSQRERVHATYEKPFCGTTRTPNLAFGESLNGDIGLSLKDGKICFLFSFNDRTPFFKYDSLKFRASPLYSFYPGFGCDFRET